MVASVDILLNARGNFYSSVYGFISRRMFKLTLKKYDFIGRWKVHFLRYLYFYRSPTQRSSPVHLCSGEFFFMQAIMKAGSSSYDHLGVGVLQPTGDKDQPILNGDLFSELPGLSSVQGYDHT